MNLYKFRAKNPGYDRNRHFSTGPEWLIKLAGRTITDPQEAQQEADKLRKEDCLPWEPTPL